MSLVERKLVKRVRAALAEAGSDVRIVELATTARSAEDAARALDCEPGCIVKSLAFTVGTSALVAGDRLDRLASVLDLEGDVSRANADTVKGTTGFSIGGVPSAGQSTTLPTVIDSSLRRFALFMLPPLTLTVSSRKHLMPFFA